MGTPGCRRCAGCGEKKHGPKSLTGSPSTGDNTGTVGVLTDDKETVARCLGGDSDAFEALYAAYGRRVMAYLLRSGFERHDAEDLCQDVFVRVFRSLGTFDASRGSLGGWISTIARNVVRKRWRRAGPVRVVDPELAEQTLADDNPGVDAEAAERVEALDDCISRLPEDMQKLIRLRYVDARTTRGISTTANLAEATVRLHLGKARELLRDCLEGKGIDM